MDYYDPCAAENIRYRTSLKLNDLFKNFWHPIFNQPLKSWWGYCPSKSCILFIINDGLSHDYFSQGDLSIADAKTCPDTALPKYLSLTQENYKGSYQIIQSRLEGSTDIIPHNQSLTNMYFKYERQSQRYYKILNTANEIIISHLSNKVYDLYRFNASPKYVSFTLNDRPYIYNFSDRAFVSTPEEPLTHISQQDIISNIKHPPIWKD